MLPEKKREAVKYVLHQIFQAVITVYVRTSRPGLASHRSALTTHMLYLPYTLIDIPDYIDF